MIRFCLRSMLLAILILLAGLPSGKAQEAESLLRNYNYESYLEVVNGKEGLDPGELDPQQIQNMARAHFQRARVFEKLYHLSLESSIGLFELIQNGEDSVQYSRAIDRIRLRQTRLGTVSGGTNPKVYQSDFERSLLKWHRNGKPDTGCSSAGGIDSTYCVLLNHLISGGVSDYASVINLLDDISIDEKSETLLSRLNESATLNEMSDIVIGWVNYIQLQMLTDYTLAAWLFELTGSPFAQVAFFKAKNWERFSGMEESGNPRIEIYRSIGREIFDSRTCNPGNLPEEFFAKLGSNNELFQFAADAMSSCTSRASLVDRFSEKIESVDLQEGSNHQIYADALIALGHHEQALEVLEDRISRRHFFDLSVISPQTAATLMLVKYVTGGATNWGEARRFAFLLGDRFDGATPAGLILQLATQTELRNSINLYID